MGTSPRTFAEIAKDSPAVGDVHIQGAPGRKKKPRKPRTEVETFDAAGDADRFAIKSGFTIAKVDEEKRLIFGWASVATKGGQLIVDKQGDVIEPEVLEPAAYDFVKGSRQHGLMHDEIVSADLVESMMFTEEKQKALGIDLGMEGWWVGFYVGSDAVWQAYKRGELPEFSIGGTAVPVAYEE